MSAAGGRLLIEQLLSRDVAPLNILTSHQQEELAN